MDEISGYIVYEVPEATTFSKIWGVKHNLDL